MDARAFDDQVKTPLSGGQHEQDVAALAGEFRTALSRRQGEFLDGHMVCQALGAELWLILERERLFAFLSIESALEEWFSLPKPEFVL